MTGTASAIGLDCVQPTLSSAIKSVYRVAKVLQRGSGADIVHMSMAAALVLKLGMS